MLLAKREVDVLHGTSVEIVEDRRIDHIVDHDKIDPRTSTEEPTNGRARGEVVRSCEELVVAGPSPQLVEATFADQDVVATQAIDLVLASATGKDVVPGRTENDVVARATVEVYDATEAGSRLADASNEVVTCASLDEAFAVEVATDRVGTPHLVVVGVVAVDQRQRLVPKEPPGVERHVVLAEHPLHDEGVEAGRNSDLLAVDLERACVLTAHDLGVDHVGAFGPRDRHRTDLNLDLDPAHVRCTQARHLKGTRKMASILETLDIRACHE